MKYGMLFGLRTGAGWINLSRTGYLWMALVLAVTAFDSRLVIGAGEGTDKDLPKEALSVTIAEAAARAALDETRPTFHFRSLAQWMNDPNGLIYHRGYYHVFYQFNPFADTWGHMHWGHARSRDLVHWQHLPIALAPSLERGEEHVFSGTTLINSQGKPMAFYTSIAQGKPAELYAEQWAAIGDKDLLHWQKLGSNPVMTEKLHAQGKIFDWRDPFVFQHKGMTYAVLGGNLNQRKGGEAIVNLYRASSPLLDNWQNVGTLFKHPDPTVVNIECPNLLPLNDDWVLIVSPHRRPEYFVGDVDLSRCEFKVHHGAVVDHGDNFYAPSSFIDPRGRRIMFGWIRGFKGGTGWNGCLSLPRVLSLGDHGELLQKPAQELRKLRGQHFHLSDITLTDTIQEISGPFSKSLEVYLDAELLDSPGKFELQLCRSADGKRAVTVSFDGTTVQVAGIRIPFCLLPAERTLQLNIFLDRSVLEVFINGRECATQVINPEIGDNGLAFAATGSARIRSFHSWTMRSAWETASRGL